MKIKNIIGLDIIKFIKLNFFSKNIERNNSAYIIPYKYTSIYIDKKAKLVLNNRLILGRSEFLHSKKETIFCLKEKSNLTINGYTIIMKGSTIELHSGSETTIGKATFNYDSVLISKNEVEIGNDVLISRNVVIIDSNFHKTITINDEKNNDKIVIGNHVWIGVNSTILKGSKIKDGAVIAAGSVVSGIVKAGMLTMGNPARSFYKIEWSE